MVLARWVSVVPPCGEEKEEEEREEGQRKKHRGGRKRGRRRRQHQHRISARATAATSPPTHHGVHLHNTRIGRRLKRSRKYRTQCRQPRGQSTGYVTVVHGGVRQKELSGECFDSG